MLKLIGPRTLPVWSRGAVRGNVTILPTGCNITVDVILFPQWRQSVVTVWCGVVQLLRDLPVRARLYCAAWLAWLVWSGQTPDMAASVCDRLPACCHC